MFKESNIYAEGKLGLNADFKKYRNRKALEPSEKLDSPVTPVVQAADWLVAAPHIPNSTEAV